MYIRWYVFCYVDIDSLILISNTGLESSLFYVSGSCDIHVKYILAHRLRISDILSWDKKNLILTMFSYPGCHVRTVHWLYLNSCTWSSSDVIVMFSHHNMSHHGVFRNFWEPF